VMGVARKCGIVERFVGLVEKVGVAALVSANGGFVLRSVGVMLRLWWVVENYISELLL